MARISTEEQRIIDAMQAVGTYKPEYLPTVSRLAAMRKHELQLRKLYNAMMRDKPQEMLEYHKPALISIMENLRRDILAYERDLGLTPAALKRIDADQATTDQPKRSPMQQLLDEVEAHAWDDDEK